MPLSPHRLETKPGQIEPSKPVPLDPSAARYELMSRSRPADYYDELLASAPARVGRVIDAGCASGRVTLRLSARASRVVGLDRSHELLCLARQFQTAQGITNADWVVGDVERPPFQSEVFDLVVSANVLRLTEFALALEQLGRLVRPGGCLAVQDVLGKHGVLNSLRLALLGRVLRGTWRSWRAFGLRMAIRILLSRFTPVELRRVGQVGRMSREWIDETFRRVLPGSSVRATKHGYLALWDKPAFKP